MTKQRHNDSWRTLCSLCNFAVKLLTLRKLQSWSYPAVKTATWS